MKTTTLRSYDEIIRSMVGIVNQTKLILSLPFPDDFWEEHTAKACRELPNDTQLDFEDGTYLIVSNSQYEVWQEYVKKGGKEKIKKIQQDTIDNPKSHRRVKITFNNN